MTSLIFFFFFLAKQQFFIAVTSRNDVTDEVRFGKSVLFTSHFSFFPIICYIICKRMSLALIQNFCSNIQHKWYTSLHDAISKLDAINIWKNVAKIKTYTILRNGNGVLASKVMSLTPPLDISIWDRTHTWMLEQYPNPLSIYAHWESSIILYLSPYVLSKPRCVS